MEQKVHKKKNALDKLDLKIISLLIAQRNSKQISAELGVPSSTIQRRIKNIIENGIMNIKIEPNFKRLGIKRGLLHIYLTMRLQ
jgi:DNA-binding Lrp family transcriptional regulator